MRQPANDVIPLFDERRGEQALGRHPELSSDDPGGAQGPAHALWMLSVSVMLGVVVVAGLATAALAVRAAS